MFSIRPSPRVLGDVCRACRASKLQEFKPASRRQFTSQSTIKSSQKLWTRSLGAVLGFGAGIALYHYSHRVGLQELHAESPPASAELIFEKPKKKGLTKEDNRDSISTQHLQVKRSWENPGVYAWGSNSGKVVAPDSDEPYIKTARRIPFFDGILLRDIKLDQEFGAAITENGDLLQWGKAYSREISEPTPTLTGKNLVSVVISKDRVIALSSSGKIYSLPVSRENQLAGPKPQENSWIPFWSSQSPVSYRTIQPRLNSYSEKVSSIASGLEHLLILTSAGRLFTAAASSSEYPSRGQLGVPGLSWTHRPAGAYDQPHELSTLKGFEIRAIAAGDYHSLALDSEGRVFSFGDNSSGQLGFDPTAETTIVDAPSLVPISRLYIGSNLVPTVTSISAGGSSSLFTVDALRTPGRSEQATARGVGRISADTWACGQGILGMLGSGRWTHIQGTPAKIKSLSGLFEYDESTNTVTPIRLARLSIGATHAAATMANVTYLGAHAGSSENDTNWGADVVWWGGNEHYQLGTGRRNNVSVPTYIAPMPMKGLVKPRGKAEEHRFQVTPKGWARVGGRMVELEQRVECGRFVTAVYEGV